MAAAAVANIAAATPASSIEREVFIGFPSEDRGESGARTRRAILCKPEQGAASIYARAPAAV
jgi:hypothetical protein